MTTKKRISKGFLADIAELAETNADGEALEEVARYFNYKQLESAFKHINALHVITGFLDSPIADIRRRFSEQLFSKIKNEFGENTLLLIQKQL